jgi:CTP synthase (UTP-ammonia lyase)
LRIGLIGERHEAVRAHRAIPVALARAGERLGVQVEETWLPTSRIPPVPDYVLSAFDGLWCVPASPYASMERALAAIQFARANGTPFLGTCGGFQHALIEYARNVAGLADADHAESNPDAVTLIVKPLACSLVGKSGRVTLDPGTRAAEWYGGLEGTEEYVCSYGLNPEHRKLFERGPMKIVGRDDGGDPRIVELIGHPFFLATLFQPELRSEGEGVHPLVVAFVERARRRALRSPPEH